MSIVENTFCLLLACPDRKGIVAAVANFLAEHDASIVEAKQFNDHLTKRFYMRAVFSAVGPKFVAIENLSRCRSSTTACRICCSAGARA
jgi:formyltetrahydrofolate deformylase